MLNKSDFNEINEINEKLKEYQSKYPNNGIESFEDPLICLFILPKKKNFHPVYMEWNGLNNIIYLDYSEIKNGYIAQYRPIVIGKYLEQNYVVVERLETKSGLSIMIDKNLYNPRK